MILPILAGVVSGAIAAVLGYAKSAGESFDPKKAIQTLIVGGFVGGVAGAKGITYEAAADWLGSIGAITLVEYVKKAVWKRIRKE